MRKKIMILGAGIYQVPLIKKARELGLYTIVVSIKGDYPGFAFADKVYYENTTDCERVLEIASDEQIAGICTSGTDVAIITLGTVCESLNLPGISIASAEKATNKLAMKDAFEKAGVRTARFRKVESEAQAVRAFTELNAPVIFKATDTSGSRGIVKVENESEIADAVSYVSAATKLDYFIVEEFVEGVEFGAQSAVVDGKMQFVMPHGDIVFNGKTDVPIGHYVPYGLPEDVAEDVRIQTELTIDALGLRSCAINMDFILKEGKVYVLEAGARVGATCLAEQTGIYYNIDYYKYLIDISLGKVTGSIFLPQQANGSLLFVSDRDGCFQDIIIPNENDYAVYEKVFDYQQGEPVREFKVGPDRIGHIIITEKDEGSVIEKLEEIKTNYQLSLQ